jgi:hypothetical protein
MRIVRTSRFVRQAERLLTELELRLAEYEITTQPERWPIVQGTGGCRKARARRGRRGKSGGVRIIYFFQLRKDTIYMLELYAKNERDDLSDRQRAELRRLAKAFQEI